MQEMQETQVRSLGWEDPLEKGMATHSSIPGLEDTMDRGPLAGYSPWGCKELDMTEHTYNLHHFGLRKI